MYIEETSGGDANTTVQAGDDAAATGLFVTLDASKTIKDLTVTFKNLTVLVAPTGVSLIRTPYLWMVIAGVLIAAAALFFGRRRRTT